MKRTVRQGLKALGSKVVPGLRIVCSGLLRAVGAQVLDFASRGKRGRKAVSLKTVVEIESHQTKRLR